MAESPLRLAPQAALPRGELVLSAGLRLAVPPPRASVWLQLPARIASGPAGIVIDGVPPPGQPNNWSGDRTIICWAAPDAWLLQSAGCEGAELAAEIHAACAGLSCAITDLSDALVTLALEGADACAVLARGCGLDLSPIAFGVGACARTRLANCAVLIRNAAPSRLELIVDRSHAQYLHDWLLDAASVLAKGNP